LPQYDYTGLHDPSGRYLAFYESGRTRFDGYYFIIDLTSCAQERCQMQTVLGEPHWSPDGSQIVMAERPIRNRDNDPYEPFQLPLSRSDRAGELVTALGTGYAPAWVDNEHYGYLRLNEERVSEWVVAAVADARVQVELEAEDLLTAVSANSRPEQLFMRDTIIANPDRIAIIAATELLTDSLDYVFLWDRASEPQLMQIGEGLQVAFSPDGRYLTITGLDGIVTLINLSTGDQQQFLSPQVSPDWTADSQWLLTGRDNYLLLTAVNDDYQQIVLRDLSGCKQISWSQ
jgi:hypothetical protein